MERSGALAKSWGRRRLRVLVVDNEPLVAGVIARYLYPHTDVAVETRPLDALQRMRAGERFDVVLSDFNMPGIDGYQFFARLCSEAPEMRRGFAFVTGEMGAEAQTLIASSGRPWLRKPVAREELVELVQALAGWR